MLIVFEGLDRSGKSTQLKKLSSRLSNEHYKVTEFIEPGSTAVGQVVRNIVKNTEEKLSPITQLLLFGSARSELSKTVIKRFGDKINDNENFILFDRWKASSFAYQGAFISDKNTIHLWLNSIDKVNEISSYGIFPNITFFLDTSIDTILARLKTENDAFSKNGENYYRAVDRLYKKFIVQNPKENFIIIDSNDKTIDQIHEEIFQTIMKKLGVTNVS